jgi:hypothetical protein
MKLLVAITDLNWFNYLSELRPDEVNFWQRDAQTRETFAASDLD